MSKSRNEFQKARRVYLAHCKKIGAKPLSIEDYKKSYEEEKKWLAKKADKLVAKVAKKPVKAAKAVKKDAKKAAKKRVPIEHFIYEGDIIRFKGFTPDRIARYAINLLTSVIESVIQ